MLTGDPEYGGLNLLLPGVFFKWSAIRAKTIEEGKLDRAKEDWYKSRREARAHPRPIFENFANLVLNNDSILSDVGF